MNGRYDIIIIGAGAAGLTAAIFASRRGLNTIVISQDIGGQASTTGLIENYPCFDKVDGLTLMMSFKKQAEKYGTVTKLEEVKSISLIDQGYKVITNLKTYTTTAIILAQGLTHTHLNVPGEDRLSGRGVSYCATCDGPLFKGKEVVVVGGGNSAMDAALLMSRFCPRVTIVTVNKELRGEKILIERIMNNKIITKITHATTKEITGENFVTGVILNQTGRQIILPVSGVFVEIGYTVNPQLIKDLTPLDQRNQIIIDPLTNGTSIPGLFAAGDVTQIQYKQIVISAGEGAKAALGVDQYLQSLGHRPRTGNTDWGETTPHHFEKTLPVT